MESITEKRWAKERKLNNAQYGQSMTNIEIAGAAGMAFGTAADAGAVPIWAMRWLRTQRRKKKLNPRKESSSAA